MTEKVFLVPRLDDLTVVKLFEELKHAQEPEHFNIDVLGIGNIDAKSEKHAPLLREELSKPNSYLINEVNFGFPHFNFLYIRGGESNRPSATTDNFKIRYEPGESGINRASRLKLLKLLHERVGPTTTAGSFGKPASFDDLESLYRSTVLKLETAFARQIEKLSTLSVEQAAAAEKRRLELAEETQHERERLQKEFEQKSATLRTAQDELEQKRKELDDRDYMHARRANRGDIQKLISAREAKFSLTGNTRSLRTPIHVAMIALTSLLAVANVVVVYQLANLDWSASTGLIAWTLAKQGLLGFALIGTVLYYVRWMNRWFEEHADAEFLLKQFQLDIDRASWAVETALEWRRIENSEVPTPLLEGITRNLFVQRDVSLDKPSARDNLASALVGNAAQVKLKLGENEVSIDQKGLNALGKS